MTANMIHSYVQANLFTNEELQIDKVFYSNREWVIDEGYSEQKGDDQKEGKY